eukprot:TRINITY_DN64332_c0_g1_i1.p1 TRINITY_DN64332_c0_g1~~TRINITY_DN64332_c0_g1_i1.p1  ORF type:complete len:176 (+),score=17.82 TRINITY_DN64332_c0_g1_i1:65-529(+)
MDNESVASSNSEEVYEFFSGIVHDSGTPPPSPRSCGSTVTSTTKGTFSGLNPVTEPQEKKDTSGSPAKEVTTAKVEVVKQEFSSVGGAKHNSGTCKPCAWIWKSVGCNSGYACEFCHICPKEAIKSRRKIKTKLLKLAKTYKFSISEDGTRVFL